MKAKRLPSGSYRCQVYLGNVDGKKIIKSITAPTKREAEFKALELANGYKAEHNGRMELGQAMRKYNTLKENVLSPATIKEYNRLSKKAYPKLIYAYIDDITQPMIQSWANEFAAGHSPKSQRNAYGYLSAVLGMFRPSFRHRISLSRPEPVPKNPLPNDDQIAELLKQTEGTEMYKAILLSAFGSLRRSEICALSAEDVSGNTIRISKAMVMNSAGKWVIKQPKSEAGYRTIPLPEKVITALPTKGRAVDMTPNYISKEFKKIADRIGLHCRFHDLRHYYASFLHSMGIPDMNIMALGGWHDVDTLRSHYEQPMDSKTEEAVDLISQNLEKFTR